MRHERLFLCAGAAKPTGAKYPGNTQSVPLLLWGADRNIELKISDITQRMGANLPDLFTDLLEIAAYVYSADQTTPRGGAGSRDMHARWRRNMNFVIPVRKPSFWSQNDVKDVLQGTLNFLSDDNYDLRFVTLTKPPPADNYFEFSGEDIAFEADEILPFSGGLDSLGGAISEIFIDGKRTALVSHRSAPKIAPKQRDLYGDVSGRSPKGLRPMHIPVWIQKHGWEAVDDSQRSRSFLYASLAATVAHMFGKHRIRFYENGVTSVNLPVAEQILGARATRTTHPKSIDGFRRLFSLISGRNFGVETPFLWKTKADVLELMKKAGHADLIKHAVSCSHVWGMTRMHTHCGSCSQCIDRRLAVLASATVEHDPDEMYKTDVFIGERSDEKQDIVLAESYVRSMRECADLTDLQFFSRHGELSRAVPFIPGNSDEAATKVFRLHRRNGEQIKKAIANALIHYADIIGEKDPPDRCLMRQLFGSKIPTEEPQRKERTETTGGPAARNWGEVSIEVIDDQTVRYKIGEATWKRANCAELGFGDERRGLPNKLWPMFLELARNCRGEYVQMQTPGNVSKDMDRIRGELRAFFRLTAIPFRYDRKVHSYHMMFHLRDMRQESDTDHGPES